MKEEFNKENLNSSESIDEEELKASQKTDQVSDEAAKDVQNASEESSQETAEPLSELEQAQALVEEYKDKYLRQVAEFDNYRKRVIKEKAELIKNGGEKVISAILPIVDDFERASENMAKMEDIDAVKEGVELIIEKFLTALHKEGLEKIDAVGQPFDVDFHEAIAMVPSPSDEMKGKVIDCVQTGYKLNDKVIRHAKVAVAE
jgi:molecular chaperone GrpE